ncbi:MAG: DUF421 domain-containing protein [Chloroflexi bacterium]|nr:DUF421 domain-containing protein [Chloroflexota bacterium]
MLALSPDLLVPGVPLAEKIVRPLVIYLFLVAILRLGGRRELGQMNPFDLVVLLTLSNTVQNAIIGNDNSLLGGVVGATTLVVANLVVGRVLYRFPSLEGSVSGEPIVLARDGRLIPTALKQELITADEVLSAVHRAGVASVQEVQTAYLEASGNISVIPESLCAAPDSMRQLDERLARIETLLGRLEPRTSA